MPRFTVSVERLLQELPGTSNTDAWVDAELMDRFGLEDGQAASLSSFRGKTYVRLLRSEQDRGAGVIRIGRYVRQSGRFRIGETVEINPCTVGPVTQMQLTPAMDIGTPHHLVEHLVAELSSRQVMVSKGTTLFANFPKSTAGITYRVDKLQPECGYITPETQIKVMYVETHTPDAASNTFFEDIGGLDQEVALLREQVQLPLQYPWLYRQLGTTPPRGIIFYGPPGSGKTLLARAMANEIDAHFYYINGPDIVGTMYGETEANLRKLFAEATHHAPSLILIDELDALTPKRGETGAHADTRAVTQLLSLMDGITRTEGVMVVATTNRLDAIDMALRRPGRFDREIFVGPPSVEGRLQILKIHSREMALAPDAVAFLPEVAARSHGFVGADLMELCRQAALMSLRRAIGPMTAVRDALQIQGESLQVTQEDFVRAMAKVRPSAMREALVTVPSVSWEQIGGLGTVKERLRNLANRLLKSPAGQGHHQLNHRTGIVLHGPSGTGKTLLAQALATECGVNFLTINGPEIFSKWLGESEETLRHVFRVARQLAPAIIFIDQLDSLAPLRGSDTGSRTTERVVNQLLVEVDGIDPLSNILVMASTNRIDLVDPSVLRPGRFGIHLHVGLPEAADRAEIARVHLRGANISGPALEEWTQRLVAETEGCSAAVVANICQEARLQALAEQGYTAEGPLTLKHLQEGVQLLRDNRHG